MNGSLPSLIGLSRESPLLKEFVVAIPHQARLDRFGGLVTEHYPEDGLSLYYEESGSLRTIFLHSGRTADGVRYSGNLPADLTFEFGRGDAILRLGAPNLSGTRWDRWIYENKFLHLKYSADCSAIDTIRIFSLEAK